MAWPAPPSGETQWRIGFLSLARHGKSLVLGPLIDTLNDQGAFASNSANQPLSRVIEANADDDEANFDLALFDLDDDDVHLVVTGSSPATYAALEHRDRNGVKLTKPVVMVVGTPPENLPNGVPHKTKTRPPNLTGIEHHAAEEIKGQASILDAVIQETFKDGSGTPVTLNVAVVVSTSNSAKLLQAGDTLTYLRTHFSRGQQPSVSANMDYIRVEESDTSQDLDVLPPGHRVYQIGSPAALPRLFDRIRRNSHNGVIVVGDQLLGLHRDDVIIAINDLHTHNPELKLPVVFSGTEDVATGGLMCYGPEHERLFKRVGPIIHQVCAKLNGSDPTPLTSIDYIRPSLEDMRVVVNFGTAKGHGVKIPDLTLLSTF